mmetsp:Transcript_2676/g.7312  ORF Transcript_2676/g.7312 Transcript_2676/m.7312 type:complete len:487 (-) Transcript_2676:790-2250(-)
MLVHRVDREGPGRVRRARQDVLVRDDLDDVGSVPTAGALRVVRVDRPSLHRGDAVVDEPALVERVGVDGHRDVVLVGESEAGVDARRRRPPVLVELESRRAGFEAILQDARVGGVALTGETEVEGVPVGRLEHHPELRRRRGAGRGGGPRRRSRPTSEHRRQSAGDRLVDLLRADVVNVRVDAAGRHDHLLSGDDVRGGTDGHPGRDAVHRVGIPGFADPDDEAPLDPDVGLDDPRDAVDDQSVGDHDVEGLARGRARRLSHALPEGLPSTELALLSVGRQVFFDLDDELRVTETDGVTDGRSVDVGVGRPGDDRRFPERMLRRGCVPEPTRFHPIRYPSVVIEGTVVEAVSGDDFSRTTEVDERHGLGLTGFEPDARSARDVQPFPNGRGPVEDESLVGLQERVVRSDLNGPIAGVRHADLQERIRPVFVQHDARCVRIDRDFTRYHQVVFFVFFGRIPEDREVRNREEGSLQRQGHITVDLRDG